MVQEEHQACVRMGMFPGLSPPQGRGVGYQETLRAEGTVDPLGFILGSDPSAQSICFRPRSPSALQGLGALPSWL